MNLHRRSLLSAALCVVVLVSVQAKRVYAELPQLIPRSVLFGNPQRAAPRISPDGKTIAYLAPEKGVLNVWVRSVGQTDDRVVTSDTYRGIRSYFWQPDSSSVIYTQDQGGDENFHVYQTNIQTKETRDLTPFAGARANILEVNPNYPDEILVAINARDKRLFDVYRVNLKTGKAEMDTENPGDVGGWGTDNKMQVRIANVTTPDGGTESRLRDDAKSPWRTFQKWSADETGAVIGFAPDDKSLWVISSINANAARLLQVDPVTNKQTIVAEDKQFDVGAPLINPRTHVLEAVSFDRARRDWVVVDQAVEADFAAIRKIRDADFNITSRDFADKTWIITSTADDGPVYYYAYDRATKHATKLFSLQPELEKYKLAKIQPISYQARDGMTVYGYLTLPVGVAPKNLPMVLFVHGDPWARDFWGYSPYVQWLANRGYAVLQINYRGSTGYGKKYLNAGDCEWAGKMHTDLIDGKQWAVKQGYADPKRVGIMGGSYGGYATLVALTFTPEEFACGVDIVGPSNLVTLLKTIPPYWVTGKAMFSKRVGNLETEEDFLKSRSPLFLAEKITKPLLIGQGANDPRVKQAEAEQIVAAMQKANLPVTYVLYSDEGHGFARPANSMHFNGIAEEFLAKHLGGRFEPLGEIKGTTGVIKVAAK